MLNEIVVRVGERLQTQESYAEMVANWNPLDTNWRDVDFDGGWPHVVFVDRRNRIGNTWGFVVRARDEQAFPIEVFHNSQEPLRETFVTETEHDA